MTEWQPIETAPKDGTTVDLWCVAGFGAAERAPGMEYRDGSWEHELAGDELNEGWTPAHWRPLPPPPT